MIGIVRKSTGSWYEILTPEGEEILARIKGKFRLDGMKSTNPIAVGDKVKYQKDKATGDIVINELIDRKNYIVRKSNNLSKQKQVIAANLDQVLILATLVQPRTSQGFIDRLLVTAEAYEIPATIVFNKIDLYKEQELEQLAFYKNMYSEIGYPVHAISAHDVDIKEHLVALLHNKVTLLTGHSGVGKSTLMNVLNLELQLKTGKISDYSSKGMHTTTFAEMHKVWENSYVIDTPGIKDFGLVDFNKEEVSHFFPELRNYLGQCKFSNCLHVNEPGCKVREALENEEIHPARFNSYISILFGEDVHH